MLKHGTSHHDNRNAALREPLTHLLHRAVQTADRFVYAASDGLPQGLTVRQYILLRAIGSCEGQSQVELTAQTGIDRSTLADMVRRLVSAGLVVRQRSRPDRRAYSIKLSSRGEIVLKAGKKSVERAEARLFDTLPTNLQAPLLAALETLIGAETREPR